MDIITIISITLNIILFILLFFKSALNDIVIQLWSRKQDKKNKLRMLLIEINSNLNIRKSFDSYSLLLLNKALSKEQSKMIEEFIITSPLKDANNHISKNLFALPQDVRNRIEKYNLILSNFIGESATKQISKERISEMNSMLIEDISDIMEIINDKIKQL